MIKPSRSHNDIPPAHISSRRFISPQMGCRHHTGHRLPAEARPMLSAAEVSRESPKRLLPSHQHPILGLGQPPAAGNQPVYGDNRLQGSPASLEVGFWVQTFASVPGGPERP